MSLPFPTVARARPSVIDDHQLTTLRGVAHAAPQGLASPAEAEWLLAALPSLLDELAARRAWMDGNAAGVDLANIIPMPGLR